jgi:hypothetical protein
MKTSLLFCIALGVFTAHLGALMLLSHLRPQPKFAPRPKENFSMKGATFTDSRTGEKMIYQEFTVSTRLAPPESTPPPAKPHLELQQNP